MLPLWFPDPLRVDGIVRTGAVTIERLCDLAMKTVTATDAKNRFGRVLDEALANLVILARRGKECVALMPVSEARLCILSACATGVITRSVAMHRLGYVWYGQLTDAMTDAGLHIQLPESVLQQMDKSLDTVFGKRVKGAKRHV